MVVFDLRVAAQQITWMYLVAPITVFLVLASLAPYSVRARLPLILPEDVRRLAMFFIVLSISMVLYEGYERRQAESLVEQCLSGSCNVVEGRVSEVRRVHIGNSGGRYSPPPMGSFRVGDTVFFHYPGYFEEYSPCNLLNNGDLVRVHTMDKGMVLVEKLETDHPR